MIWLGAALAAQTGIVVQFYSNGLPVDDEVVALLVNNDDEVAEVVLTDDGAGPDVGADDGRYAGAVMVNGDTFNVSVVIDGDEEFVGVATYADDGSPRDLIVAWRNDAFVLEAGAAPPMQTEPEGAQGPTAPTDLEGPDAPTAPTAPSGPEPAVTMPGHGGPEASQGGDEPLLLIGLGVGLLVLAGIALAWIRGSGSPGYRVRTAARLQPEPPFLGGPRLSDGLATVKASDPSGAAKALLPKLAQHHRVLVAGFEPPEIWGGPVYAAESTKPIHIADAAEDLLGGPGLPLVVLVVGIEGLADQLPEGVGGLAVSAQGDWTLHGGRLVSTQSPGAAEAPA